MRAKRFPDDGIDTVIGELASEGLVDDSRFAGMLARRRAEQGYGRMRVASELRQLGVSAATVAGAIDDGSIDWDAVLMRLYTKRFGSLEPRSDHDRQVRWRYLLQRGFSSDQIQHVLRATETPNPLMDS